MKLRTQRWSSGSIYIPGTERWLCWRSAPPLQEYHRGRVGAGSRPDRWEVQPPSWPPRPPEQQKTWEGQKKKKTPSQGLKAPLYSSVGDTNRRTTCQEASLCAGSVLFRRSVRPDPVAWPRGVGCGCPWTPGLLGCLCSASRKGRAADRDKEGMKRRHAGGWMSEIV